MEVSVIIPVYNAAPFLDKSIHSALDQKQTGEVLLIDDRSTDESLEICKRWELLDSRVKIFVNEGTKGAAAARNIGLEKAQCEFISFLDADDYFLTGRFNQTEIIFNSFQDAEGVCESVMVKLEKKSTQNQVLNIVYRDGDIIGIRENRIIVDLHHYLFTDYFYITGLTIKKSLALKAGNFDQTLIQTQDTDYIYNVLLSGTVYSGIYDSPPVVLYRHDKNTTNQTLQAILNRRKLARKRLIYFMTEKLNYKLAIYFFKKYAEYDYLLLFGQSKPFKKITKFLLLPYIIIKLFFHGKSQN